MQISIQEIYGDSGMSKAMLDDILNRSLNPRPPTMLYQKMEELGLTANHFVLDIGCRDTRHSCELARQYHCRVLGIDPVDYNLARAERLIAEQQMGKLVSAIKGVIEAIPAEDATVDYIWCRDVLTHVADLHVGFIECARVLKPGGRMLNYQTFATDLLEPDEAARIYPPLAVVPANMSATYFEQALQGTGLTIIECDKIGSEWREWWEENEVNTTSKQLLQIARMQRDRERIIREVGAVEYEVELANSHWGVYQMLGKLCPTCYVLQKAER